MRQRVTRLEERKALCWSTMWCGEVVHARHVPLEGYSARLAVRVSRRVVYARITLALSRAERACHRLTLRPAVEDTSQFSQTPSIQLTS